MMDLPLAKPNNKALSGQRLVLLWFGVSRSAAQRLSPAQLIGGEALSKGLLGGERQKNQFKISLDRGDGDTGLFSTPCSYFISRQAALSEALAIETQPEETARGWEVGCQP